MSVRSTLFVAALYASSATIALHAQTVPDRASGVEMRVQYIKDLDSLQGRLVALAQAFPADKFSWRPAAGIRSVGEVFMHAASEFYIYVPLSYGTTRSDAIARGQDAMKAFEAKGTKEEVLKQLHDAWAFGRAAVMAVPVDSLVGTHKMFGGTYTVIETSLSMVDDMHEHLGQLIAYARMNGVVPPWSK